MKIISRSQWTSAYPKSNTGTEDTDGLPNYRSKDVNTIFLATPNLETQFVERDPYLFFEQQRKDDLSRLGYGDIQYNLGVAQNVDGVFILRGLCNKSAAQKPKENNNSVSIYCLLGNQEKPTDLFVDNLTNAKSLITSRFDSAAGSIVGNEALMNIINNSPPVGKSSAEFRCSLTATFSPETSVHVHELIESLAFWGYYRGRNDGTYGPVTLQAVRELQADLKDLNFYHKRIDGKYGRATREGWCLLLRQLSQSPQKELLPA